MIAKSSCNTDTIGREYFASRWYCKIVRKIYTSVLVVKKSKVLL